MKTDGQGRDKECEQGRVKTDGQGRDKEGEHGRVKQMDMAEIKKVSKAE